MELKDRGLKTRKCRWQFPHWTNRGDDAIRRAPAPLAYLLGLFTF